MRSEEIIGLMKGEIPYTNDALSELTAVLEEYPYFQTAHILYTLNLLAGKNSCFNASLRKTVCYAGDRKQLFYLIEQDAFPPEMIEKLEKKEAPAMDTSFDLIDFFLAKKNEGNERNEKNERNEGNEKNAGIVSTDYLTYLFSAETLPASAEPVAWQHGETIDKFLAADEKSPVKIALRDPVDSVENALPHLDIIEEGSFFSETLAKIYLKQKKYEKALEIIRKLNLLYPEKNRYFADQIRFLEKLIINLKN